MADRCPPANVMTSAALKRRGIVAIEQALQHGPVHLLKRNQPASLMLSEQHDRQLQRQAAQAPWPPRSKAAMDAEFVAERDW